MSDVVSACNCGRYRSAVDKPSCPVHTSSLSSVVAEAVNRSAFKAPIYFGPTNHTPRQRTDAQWKRDTFPQETH